ncbi:MAG: NifU family protein [Candidatus Wallbacteria bacterium]|nr:NifU family protein [Candidatus Wallbacteria bacterium]
MTDPTPVYIDLEWTPNPNTIKLVTNRALLERGVANFRTPDSAVPSTLAQKLFTVPGIAAVMIGSNFVTLTRTEEGDWVEIHEKAVGHLRHHLEAGLPALEGPLPQAPAAAGAEGEIQLIRDILENEIRPAVAMDGGDITFERYEDGVLYVHMVGSCSGCPSSTMTLRVGIENRLREVVPSLREVVPA